MMVFLRVPKKHGAFFSSFLWLSVTVGGIMVLVWAITPLLAASDSSLWTSLHLKSDPIDSVGVSNAASFPNGPIAHPIAHKEISSDLSAPPRRRLGEGSTRRIPGANNISTTQTFRLALFRPFAPHDATDLVESFEEWNKFIPCDNDAWFRSRYDTDLILSISQTFSSHPRVKEMIDRLMNGADAIGSPFLNGSSWRKCFNSVRIIEAKIKPDVDRYGVSSSDQTDPLW